MDNSAPAEFRALLPHVGLLHVDRTGSACLDGRSISRGDVMDIAQAFARASYLVNTSKRNSRRTCSAA